MNRSERPDATQHALAYWPELDALTPDQLARIPRHAFAALASGIPPAIARLERDGPRFLWRIAKCKICGAEHFHAAGPMGCDPYEELGERQPHCATPRARWRWPEGPAYEKWQRKCEAIEAAKRRGYVLIPFPERGSGAA